MGWTRGPRGIACTLADLRAKVNKFKERHGVRAVISNIDVAACETPSHGSILYTVHIIEM